MLNAATVTYQQETILKVTVNRNDLPQYWAGIKQRLTEHYDRGNVYTDQFGRERIMFGEGELAVRHIIDWETIERYWKKRLKGMVIAHADRAQSAQVIVEEKIAEILGSLARYHFAPQLTICRQAVPVAVVPDNQMRFSMNLSLMFMLAMNDLDNLFLGDAGHNSSLGAQSSDAKGKLKANYPGESQNRLVQSPEGHLGVAPVTIHKESKQHAVVRLQEAITGRASGMRVDHDTSRQLKVNNQNARFDDGRDNDYRWGINPEQLRLKREEFNQMWGIAWLAKPGKYG